MGGNPFSEISFKSEGFEGSSECKQPKIGKSYTTPILSPISMKAKPFNWILTYSYAHKSLQSKSYNTKQQFSIIVLYGWKNLWVTVNFLPLCKIYFDFDSF